MKKIVITGGAGFVGSHIVEGFAAAYPDATVHVLDKMTYAAHIRNVLDLMIAKRVNLIVGDVCDLDTCKRAVDGADLVIHAAAESHVDNSFGNSLEFTKTNVVGTHSIMEACRAAAIPKIIHVSTDEVYGEVLSGTADEESLLKPTNPYSASKAAAEMILSGYRRSFNLPVITIRANNIFGIRQYPEKIIPRFTMLLMTGKKLTMHGTGQYRRHYLAAQDLSRALNILAQKGAIGECYNIGTTEEYTNLEMADGICDVFGLDPKDHITFVTDRPFNDARYAINWDKLSALGWSPQHSLCDDLPDVVRWYVENYAVYGYGSESDIIRRPIAGDKIKRVAG